MYRKMRVDTVNSITLIFVALLITVNGALGYCTALYNYAATAPDQLSLKTGECIAVLSKAREKTGWWRGRIGSQVRLTSSAAMFMYNVCL